MYRCIYTSLKCVSVGNLQTTASQVYLHRRRKDTLADEVRFSSIHMQRIQPAVTIGKLHRYLKVIIIQFNLVVLFGSSCRIIFISNIYEMCKQILINTNVIVCHFLRVSRRSKKYCTGQEKLGVDLEVFQVTVF